MATSDSSNTLFVFVAASTAHVLHQISSSSGRSSLIGVAISFAGNVLISLALNCQKLAHLRLQREAQGLNVDGQSSCTARDGNEQDGSTTTENTRLLSPQASSPVHSRKSNRRGSRQERSSAELNNSEQEQNGQNGNSNGDGDNQESHSLGKSGMSTDFLTSRLWWLGILLMTLGEFGNFVSYGFAPASLVAPLGAVALLSNVIFAPLLLNERFRPSDLGGIFMAILGAVTVVFSSKQNDATLSPDQLLHAVSQKPFIVYVIVSVTITVILIWASTTSLGNRYILLDVGVCALFGGFTVLSTKGLSSFFSHGRPLEVLRYPITYALLAILVSTALAQITYLNRALQRFDSREVIPTQFVTFTLSAIVGSAILYQDFADMDVHRLINFTFGCMTTFGGVYVLTRGRHHDDDDEDDDDGDYIDEEELIGQEQDEGETQFDHEDVQRKQRKVSAASGSAAVAALPVAVPRTHPAAVNQARRNKRRLLSRASLVNLASGSAPTVALQQGGGVGANGARLATGLSTSLQDLEHMPIVIARRSIFNPAFTIAYIDPVNLPPSNGRRQGR